MNYKKYIMSYNVGVNVKNVTEEAARRLKSIGLEVDVNGNYFVELSMVDEGSSNTEIAVNIAEELVLNILGELKGKLRIIFETSPEDHKPVGYSKQTVADVFDTVNKAYKAVKNNLPNTIKEIPIDELTFAIESTIKVG